jgi:N6-adenosine-specific RNA methylase IME4
MINGVPTLLDLPIWEELVPHLKMTSFKEDKYVRVDFSPLPAELATRALAVVVSCISCARIIHPMRSRKKSTRSRIAGTPIESGLFHTATCMQKENSGCCRTHVAREYRARFRDLYWKGTDPMSHHANVIVADPPWPFGDKLPGPGRGAEKHYKVMTIDEIKSYLDVGPLKGLVEDDAMLVLWRVGSQQQEALDVVKAWGFVVKSEIVWVKTKKGTPDDESDEAMDDPKSTKIGMGHYVRNEHEIALVCTRGKFKVADRGVRSTFRAPLGEHSEKPAKFFELIERLAGEGRKGHMVELFARKIRPGWHVMGDEIPSGYAWTPAGNTSSEVLAAPGTNTLPLGAKVPPEAWGLMSIWDRAKFRAHAYDPEVDGRPDSDEAAEEAIVREMVKAPKAARKPRKKKGDHPQQETDEQIRAELAKAPVSAHHEVPPAKTSGAAEAQSKAAVPHTNGTNGTVKYSLSDETARALYVERAVTEKLLSPQEAKNTAEGWILLQSRAPSGWFDRDPFGDAVKPPPTTSNVDTDFGSLATELTSAGAPISIVTLAGLTPMKRHVLRAWLDNEKGNLDSLPEWWRDAVGWGPKLADTWSAARTRLAKWEESDEATV